MLLSSEQVESYRMHGYLIIEDVLTPDEVAEGRRVIDEFTERSRSVAVSDDIFDLEPSHTAERPAIRRLVSPTKQHAFFDDLMHSAAILDPIESLIGPNIRGLGSKLNLKPAGAGSPVEWHQDLAFHPHSNDDLLAVGIAFDDCSLANGCLLVMAGSHLGPVLDHHQDGFFIGAVDVEASGIDIERAVPVEMRAGSIEIHHVRLLHGSAPNTSPDPRRLLLFDIAAADAFPIGQPIGDLATYDALIVRGTPQQPRTAEQPPVRLPLPLRAKGTIFEVQKDLRAKAFDGS